MKQNLRQIAPYRKAAALLALPGRRWRTWCSVENDYRVNPPVICNAFPKSGTHLLAQILAALPHVRDDGAFVASMPSVTFREQAAGSLARRVGYIGPGELVRAHLHHHDACAAALKAKHAIHCFIHRDLRDVAVSEAHYLTHMNRWHRMHRYFAALPSESDRIMLAIRGREVLRDCPYDYPNIAVRFARFAPWLNDPGVCSVRFEDLVGMQRRRTVERIVQHYESRGGPVTDREATVQRCLQAIDPARSHTFHIGAVGRWRQVFTEAHTAAMRMIGSDTLGRLGPDAKASPATQP